MVSDHKYHALEPAEYQTNSEGQIMYYLGWKKTQGEMLLPCGRDHLL